MWGLAGEAEKFYRKTKYSPKEIKNKRKTLSSTNNYNNPFICTRYAMIIFKLHSNYSVQ